MVAQNDFQMALSLWPVLRLVYLPTHFTREWSDVCRLKHKKPDRKIGPGFLVMVEEESD